MVERGAGRIVNVSSGAATRAYPHASAYAAAKAALLSFTQSLAAETAEHGIAVFAITPGVRLDGDDGAAARLARASPDFGSPSPNEPERAGELVLRLASGELDALSGRFIHVRDDLDELLSELKSGQAASFSDITRGSAGHSMPNAGSSQRTPRAASARTGAEIR